MPRPGNPFELAKAGGVAAQLKEAKQEELNYWFNLLQKFLPIKGLSDEERTIAERELRYCKRKLGIKLTADEIRAANNARVKRWHKNKANKQTPPAEPTPLISPAPSLNHQLKDGDEDDEAFDKYLDKIAAIQRLETK